MTYSQQTGGSSSQQPGTWSFGVKAGAAGLLLAWLAAAYAIGAGEVLANDGRSPFPPIAITVVVPVAAFFAAYGLVPRFRDFVLAQDIRTLTMVQLWRVIGFGFLPLYAYGVVPGLFAFPAGLGDVAVGIAALFVTLRLTRDPGAETSPALVRLQVFGLLDFVGAVTAASLASGAFPALVAGGVTSAAMDVWPLNLFPSFGVPLFIIAHAAVLLKVRHLRRAARLGIGGVTQAA